MDGYLGGQVNISTQQKLSELKSADLQTSSLASSVVSPTEGIGQNLPNPSSALAFNAQPIPSFSTFDPTSLPKNSQSIINSSQTTTVNSDSSVNVGASGELTIRAKKFEVRYQDSNGVPKTFAFSLLPAMESNLRSNHMGATVPEVKPGILLRTSMNIKRFSIPGAAPAFQSLGIEQTILQLVGLFIGAEGDQYSSADTVLYGRYKDAINYRSAYRQSLMFDQDAVQSGREVDLLIHSEGANSSDTLIMNYKCLLQNFRYFVTRADRVYYSIDALILNYRQNRLAISKVLAQTQTTEKASLDSRGATNVSNAVQSFINAARPLRSPQSDPLFP